LLHRCNETQVFKAHVLAGDSLEAGTLLHLRRTVTFSTIGFLLSLFIFSYFSARYPKEKLNTKGLLAEEIESLEQIKVMN